MRRLFFGCFVLAIAAAAFTACDPDLTAAAKPGDGGAEGGRDPSPPGPGGGDDASAAETGGGETDGGGGDEGGSEGGAPLHVIDGDNDFKPGEKFVTSSTRTGYEGFITWDSTHLYFGMAGPDVGSGDATRWVLVYIEGTPGSDVGLAYGGVQQPKLPFSAGYHVRWKANGLYTNGQKWDGAKWDEGVAAGLIPFAQRKGTFMEMSVSRASIGNPTKVKVHMSMIKEAGGDWTYSAVPAGSLTDGLDPDYTKYYEFDLTDLAKAPNTYAPKP